jgi:hypothetical protein
MDMGSERYCIPFLENLLSKLEKYKTIYITRDFDIQLSKPRLLRRGWFLDRYGF